LHGDILTVAGEGLADYAREPALDSDRLVHRDAPVEPLDDTMLRPASNPFQPDGGMRLVSGNLGRATFKTSAVEPSRRTVEAPARGPLSKLRDGDIVRLSADTGELSALVDEAEWAAREPAAPPPPPRGTGRELFALMRHGADTAERGASAMLHHMEEVA